MSAASSSRSYSGNPMTQLLNQLKENSNKRAKNDQSKGINVSRSIPNGPGYTKCTNYFLIRFFNKWKGVINPKNKTHTGVFGDVYVSKESLGRNRSNTTHNLENSLDFEEEILDEEVQANETISLSDDEIALDEARSNGSGEEIKSLPISFPNSDYPMAEDALFTMSVDTLEEGPSGFDPKESPVGTNISRPSTEDHTPDHTPESASEDVVVEDPIMQFVVQNFE
ncbi:hypothetical protein Tco_0555441 [Tanacetum coccineum]